MLFVRMHLLTHSLTHSLLHPRTTLQYHNKRLFRPAYAPGPLVCPVTRPDHQPEGVLALEQVCGLGMRRG